MKPIRMTVILATAVAVLWWGSAGAEKMPRAGKSKSEITGCLKGGRESASSRTRGSRRINSVDVKAVAGGIRVSHNLTHACCLKGKVKTTVRARTVTIRETLSGTPCRCMCASTILTRVGLKPGDWTVNVLLARGGRVEKVHKGRIKVKKKGSGGGGTSSDCLRTGCSGHVCAGDHLMTTCEFRPEYACYRNADCERQSDGRCGWTMTASLRACLLSPPRID